MVGRPGLEPGTNDLKGRCSTVELSTHSAFRQRIRTPSLPPPKCYCHTETASGGLWQNTGRNALANLLRYSKNRRYYAGFVVPGKQKWLSIDAVTYSLLPGCISQIR